jgi:predicted nucleic acid-binding protein
MTKKIEKKILLDADVISHFITGGQFGLLPSIFQEKKVILDIVVNELRAAKKFKTYIDNAISFSFLTEINF